ncbi:TIGR02996 domain-containing protein [Gemmata sp. JC673]|uniref:TIGR02996 domain-containing protein n=1 Tax=Gemmata algarum TaxID=2975278 RepID=A0ABU5F5T2_9BACT|nr:TIGR02996 domain-containing protein [Gemmata algarum]MDY3561613.1 TIGR02996 domain-containing protein [Gemmata algarum]
MNDEAGFLRALLETPADDTTRLVYADWLTERGDPESAAKARFLRLTVRFRQSGRTDEYQQAELQPLAAALPPEWLGLVSSLKVEGCPAKAPAPPPPLVQGGLRLGIHLGGLFQFVCDQGWDDMAPTGEPTVRRCAQCGKDVHYCATITDAREHADEGHCVAVDLGIVRREDDLAPRRYWVGRPSAEAARKEEERWKLDPVSEARAAGKRPGAADAAG